MRKPSQPNPGQSGPRFPRPASDRPTARSQRPEARWLRTRVAELRLTPTAPETLDLSVPLFDLRRDRLPCGPNISGVLCHAGLEWGKFCLQARIERWPDGHYLAVDLDALEKIDLNTDDGVFMGMERLDDVRSREFLAQVLRRVRREYVAAEARLNARNGGWN